MELKNNRGILFKNEKTKEGQPDFTGELNVEGKVLRLALWKKQSAKGSTYLSVQVSEPKQKEEPKTVGEFLDRKSDLDDEIPW